MNILILDDNPHRHKVLASRHPEANNIVSCFTYDEFCNRLQTEKRWDLVYLDHDLGDFQENASTWVDGWGHVREFTGAHAARDICELADERLPVHVTIQSVNPSGARAMLQMLERRGVSVAWDPFSDDSTSG